MYKRASRVTILAAVAAGFSCVAAVEGPGDEVPGATVAVIVRREAEWQAAWKSAPFQIWVETGSTEAPTWEAVLAGRVSIGADGLKVKLWERAPEGKAKSKPAKLPVPRLVAEGFVAPLTPDLSGLHLALYKWTAHGNALLGNVNARVFDVEPRTAGEGMFRGRLWVTDDSAIIQFDGTFTSSAKPSGYLHFVSTRVKSGPALWMPSQIHMEEKNLARPFGGSTTLRARVSFWSFEPGAFTRGWGSITPVDTLHPERESREMAVPEPHDWRIRIEQRLLDWLESHGVLAPAGKADAVINRLARELVEAGDPDYPWPVSSRLMISNRLECFTLENTLIVSSALVDVARTDAEIGVAIAPCVAHILREIHINERYGFEDYFLRDEAAIMGDLTFRHSPQEIQAAERLAVEMLGNWSRSSELGKGALVLRTIRAACALGRALGRPYFGDAVFSCGASAEAERVMSTGEGLDDEPAPALGSRVRVDPWSREVTLVAPHVEKALLALVPLLPVPNDNSETLPKPRAVPPAAIPRYPPAPAIQWK